VFRSLGKNINNKSIAGCALGLAILAISLLGCGQKVDTAVETATSDASVAIDGR
jgi:hypothetical protein